METQTTGNPFPLSIAKDPYFCNRDEERQRIAYNLQNIIHTLLASPRRYGKTSLVLKAIVESKLAFAHIDFFMALQPNTITSRILEGIAAAIAQILPISIQAIKKVETFIKNIHISLQLGKASMTFALAPINQDYVQTIRDALSGLDKLAAKYDQKIVIFMDEFQDLILGPMCNDIEAAVRSIAQQTSNLIFIFSGSNRHLLEQIFDDRSRPLYKLCDRINLNRISEVDYIAFINKAALTKWQQNLAEDVLQQIFIYSKFHPYYLNVICSRLWRQKKLPTKEDVTTAWEQYVAEEIGGVAKTLEALTANQRIVLQTIAKLKEIKEPGSQTFLTTVKLAHASVNQAVNTLTQKDYLYKDQTGCLKLIDPLIEYVLA